MKISLLKAGKVGACLAAYPRTLPLFMPGYKLKFLLTYFLRREKRGKKCWSSRSRGPKMSTCPAVRHLSAIPGYSRRATCKKWRALYDFCKRTLKLTPRHAGASLYNYNLLMQAEQQPQEMHSTAPTSLR